MNKRDCENCKNHTDKGCTKWECEFEPTTKNDLALIHTEGLDEEIRCTMCTNYMKSDRGCDGSCVVDKDMYKAVMDAIEKRIKPTTKNNLGVDLISRTAVLKLIYDYKENHSENRNEYPINYGTLLDMIRWVRDLPSVTPQLSSGLEKNSKKLENGTTKNDLGVDCISRQAVRKILVEAKELGSWDDSSQINRLDAIDNVDMLPSVTPQEPQTFKWCETCKEYDQEKHCCHRWSKVIRDTVEEMKQEPIKPMVEIDLYSVIKQKYIEREVLDKIRAEIEAYTDPQGFITISEGRFNSILDKYKAETEG